MMQTAWLTVCMQKCGCICSVIYHGSLLRAWLGVRHSVMVSKHSAKASSIATRLKKRRMALYL